MRRSLASIAIVVSSVVACGGAVASKSIELEGKRLRCITSNTGAAATYSTAETQYQLALNSWTRAECYRVFLNDMASINFNTLSWWDGRGLVASFENGERKMRQEASNYAKYRNAYYAAVRSGNGPDKGSLKDPSVPNWDASINRARDAFNQRYGQWAPQAKAAHERQTGQQAPPLTGVVPGQRATQSTSSTPGGSSSCTRDSQYRHCGCLDYYDYDEFVQTYSCIAKEMGGYAEIRTLNGTRTIGTIKYGQWNTGYFWRDGQWTRNSRGSATR